MRRHGFEIREIDALLGPQSPANITGIDALRERERKRVRRNTLRSQINRDSDELGQRKPPKGWGVRGSIEESYAPMRIRGCSHSQR